MTRPPAPTAPAAAHKSSKARSPPRKSGTPRRVSSATIPTQPSEADAVILKRPGGPMSTWARGSLRETESLGKRFCTAASTRSASHPKGDSR